MYANDLLAGIQAAMALPDEALPAYPRRRVRHTPPAENRRRKALKRWRQARGDEMGLAPGLLCSRDLINEIARCNPHNRKDLEDVVVMKAWQREAFGKEIIAALAKTG
jgi:ribonuclease D